ncbi:MAG: LAGLIDADG family homing endonuclease, partial [bacterium]|nr:LAGLIDADG family homing endonuclease [bacterium]
GDGNLSKPGPRAVRLRITCDNKYPQLIKRIFKSLQLLFPENKVGLVSRKEFHATDVSIYSNHLELLLGWSAKNGSKFIQNVSVPEWIKEKREYKINCLRGLIETDGSIYIDRGYKMVNFTANIFKLSMDFNEMVLSLGFNPHIYKVVPCKNKYNFNQQPFYHVRLSKNVSEFLDLVKPDKS